MDFWNKIKAQFLQGNYLNRIILINVGFFLIALIVSIIQFLFNIDHTTFNLVDIFAFPSDIKRWLFKPWTIITSMFFHEEFWHLFVNMLWLFWFGQMILQSLGQKRLLNLYLLGGVTGAGFYMLSFNLFPVFADVLPLSKAFGASAAVSAIVVAMVVYNPNLRVNLFIFGPVKILYIGLFYVGTDIVQLAASNNPGGHIAHLGGAFWGYYYIMQMKKGIDRGAWFDVWINKFFNLFKGKRNLKVTHKKPKTDYEYNAQKNAEQAEIDMILEKIQRSGYSSLSKSEKEKLFKYSNKR